MIRACDVCGTRYEAQRSTSKFCSPRCRVRNASMPKPARAADDVGVEERSGPSLYDAALAGFTQRGVADSTVAKLALSLAARIDSPRASDASRSPMALAFDRLRSQLLANVADDDDPLEEIRARYRAKRPEGWVPGPRRADHPLAQYLN